MDWIARSRTLSNSAAVSRGRSSASLASSIMSPRSRARKLAPRDRLSAPAAITSSPPTLSMASANCAPSRAPAPFCMSSVSSAAVPSRPGASASEPPRTTTCIATSGVSRFGMSASSAPLPSVTRSNSGRRTAPGDPVAADAEAATSSAPPRSAAAEDRHRPSALIAHRLRSRRRSCRSGRSGRSRPPPSARARPPCGCPRAAPWPRPGARPRR